MKRRLFGLLALSACAARQDFAGPGAPPAAAPTGPAFAPATAAPSMPRPDAMPGDARRALMAARIADGPDLAMILADQSGTAEQWLAPGPFVLALRAGRITRTVNLPGRDVRGIVDETPDPLARPDRLVGPSPAAQTYRRRVQVTNGPPGGLLVESRLVPEGTEPVRVPGLGTTRTLRRVREEGRGLDGASAAWRFENLFWLDPATGRVLASRQAPLPGGPTLDLRVIRAG
jgi:hypothetical protein